MIPYSKQTIEEDDITAVVEVLRSDWLTQGPKVQEFEEALAKYVGVKHAVAFSSGTFALQAAYFAAEIGSGDEIVTSPLTFVATANAAVWLGAKPVFADVEAETGNLDPKAAAAAVTERTKAIVPVHFAGRPADIEAFETLARDRKLVLIEDACHALGAAYKGRKIGSTADMSIFSFHPVKSITTGEGGAVLTSNQMFAERLRAFRMHGITKRHPDWRYEVSVLGQNGRLTDIQSALGISQLKKLDGFVKKRVAIAKAYLSDFSGVEEVTLPPESAVEESAWHLFPLRLRLDLLSVGRKEIFTALRDVGIGVQVHYSPVHLLSYYRELGFKPGLYPRAESFSDAVLSLPIFPRLLEQERLTVVREVKRIVTEKHRVDRGLKE
jgi:UDP-4-amino-4,6-dideoxy-N-acetyl-beta-L-altrosamine transaminase